jgi:hypothetical protein
MTINTVQVSLVSYRRGYSEIPAYKREELTDSSSLSQLADDKRVLLDWHPEESERTSGSRQAEFFVRTDIIPNEQENKISSEAGEPEIVNDFVRLT